MSTINIRPIQPEDNPMIAQVVRDVLMEMGAPKKGTAYEDESLNYMFETYDTPRKQYYVVEKEGKVIGGCGIAPLDGDTSDTICELQKMYFLSEARGQGVGFLMINKCLDLAKEEGYSKCYLETMPYMEAARKLYKKVGFTPLDQPMGDTGHYSCQSWMIKDL
ncbi:GNAT family N-acetyltransferase [Aquimarina algicola]|uniref:GNAT family N-acetyltransferase n=1 Tax=Aquimarina algicola TaxID=2589995 RepID=A0A504IUC8_9FLAO|nr:GNAT family N-acetyltransferase [Aquimarina algicola]TPN82097.1 GNAT family N-acetyltransferase [Aquimarina algicola]